LPIINGHSYFILHSHEEIQPQELIIVAADGGKFNYKFDQLLSSFLYASADMR
jgi:hypothetical protein